MGPGGWAPIKSGPCTITVGGLDLREGHHPGPGAQAALAPAPRQVMRFAWLCGQHPPRKTPLFLFGLKSPLSLEARKEFNHHSPAGSREVTAPPVP